MDRMARLLVSTIAAVMMAALATPALSQQFHPKRENSGYPVDTRPKVDEKAYKAALDRIPTPDKPYDPWGVARPADPATNGRKSN